jgi:hypothetical protein
VSVKYINCSPAAIKISFIPALSAVCLKEALADDQVFATKVASFISEHCSTTTMSVAVLSCFDFCSRRKDPIKVLHSGVRVGSRIHRVTLRPAVYRNQFVLGPRDFFQLNPYGHSPYVIYPLARRWVCLLWICLGFSSSVHIALIACYWKFFCFCTVYNSPVSPGFANHIKLFSKSYLLGRLAIYV